MDEQTTFSLTLCVFFVQKSLALFTVPTSSIAHRKPLFLLSPRNVIHAGFRAVTLSVAIATGSSTYHTACSQRSPLPAKDPAGC